MGWDWHQYREYRDEATTANYKKVGINIGLIYKITNDINEKIYIGMTTRTLEKRKADHLNACFDPAKREYGYKIYKAIRKYGVEHFKFSIIEECDNEDLPRKEKYYIKLYNSVIDGYNETYGGKGKTLWSDKQIEACKILYDNGWLLQDISDLFKSSVKTVSRKLRERYNIDTKNNSNKNNCKKIVGIKNDEQIKFESISLAAEYIVKNNISKTNSIRTAISKISNVLNIKERTAYGYTWITI